jgi:predicted  nucleic acid-binding Zn-ribbon protein
LWPNNCSYSIQININHEQTELLKKIGTAEAEMSQLEKEEQGARASRMKEKSKIEELKKQLPNHEKPLSEKGMEILAETNSERVSKAKGSPNDDFSEQYFGIRKT